MSCQPTHNPSKQDDDARESDVRVVILGERTESETMACRKRSIENDKNRFRERERPFYSQGVLQREPVIHRWREEKAERKSDTPRNLFNPHCQQQWEKRVGDGKRGERDGGEDD